MGSRRFKASNSYWERNVCLKTDIPKFSIFCFKITNVSHFHPLDVVGRGSETQL